MLVCGLLWLMNHGICKPFWGDSNPISPRRIRCGIVKATRNIDEVWIGGSSLDHERDQPDQQSISSEPLFESSCTSQKVWVSRLLRAGNHDFTEKTWVSRDSISVYDPCSNVYFQISNFMLGHGSISAPVFQRYAVKWIAFAIPAWRI